MESSSCVDLHPPESTMYIALDIWRQNNRKFSLEQRLMQKQHSDSHKKWHQQGINAYGIKGLAEQNVHNEDIREIS